MGVKILLGKCGVAYISSISDCNILAETFKKHKVEGSSWDRSYREDKYHGGTSNENQTKQSRLCNDVRNGYHLFELKSI